MLILSFLAVLAGYAGWRVARAAIESVRQLPRRNSDMVLF